MSKENLDIILRLQDLASASVAKVRKSLGEFSQSANLAKTRAEAIQERLEGIGRIGKTVAIGAGAVATTLGFLGKTALAAAGQYEQNRIAFKGLLGTYEEADRVLSRIEKVASETPFETASLTSMAQQLTTITKDGDKAVDVLLAVGDAVAKSGKDVVEMERVVLNLQQVASTGKVTELDIREFQRAIPLFNDIIASAGLTTEQLKESKNASELLFGAFRKASEEGGIAFGGLTEQSKSLNGRLSTLKDNFGIFFRQIGDALLPVVKPVIDFLIAMTNGFSRLSPTIQSGIAMIVGTVFVLASLATTLGLVAFALPSVSSGVIMLSGALGVLNKALLITVGRYAIIAMSAIYLTKAIYDNREAIKQSIQNFMQLHPVLSRVLIVLGSLITSIVGLKLAMIALSATMAVLKIATALLTGGLGALFLSLNATGLIALALAMTALTYAVYNNWDAIKAWSSGVASFFIGTAKAILSVIDSLIDKFNEFAQKTGFIPTININTKGAIKSLDELQAKLNSIKQTRPARAKTSTPNQPKISSPSLSTIDVPSMPDVPAPSTKGYEKASELNQKILDKISADRQKSIDEEFARDNQLIAMKKATLDLTLDQEREYIANRLNIEGLDEQQRAEIRNRLNQLDIELATQKMEREQYMWSEEQRVMFERERLKNRGVTQEMQIAKVVLDSARQAGSEKLSIEKQIAQGSLEFIKRGIVAEVDAWASKEALIASGRIASSYGLDAGAWGLLAIAVGASAGIRSAMNGIQLAEGGIVMPQAGGVRATVAEAGSPEAVIPLGSNEAQAMLGGGASAEQRVIILDSDGVTSLAKGIIKKSDYLRKTGQVGSGL